MAKIIDKLNKNKKITLSLEITPPDRGESIDEIFRNIDNLLPFDPEFINVTYHQPHVVYEEKKGTIIRRPKRKKPGTVGICSAIKNKFHIETVSHLICGGFDKYETEDALIDLHYLDIKNILALRGDPAPGQRNFISEKDGHSYAFQLINQIAKMNKGIYIDELDNPFCTDFCIGAAAYPEKHFESPNIDKDLLSLKKKVEMGAEYIVTQMFFDFKVFKNFVEKARDIGIKVPIIPGIKPITNKKLLSNIPKTFYVNIPKKLVGLIENARTKEQAFKNGTLYMANLANKLIEYRVPGIHVFTMGKGKSTKALLEMLSGPNW